MQRRECHRFCEKMGWTIVHEEQEDGVSGHKVRAENRDKLQIIKERAKQGKFDILLVFMFDRIGRIADETPFVVEWFVKNGIRVWSTQTRMSMAGLLWDKMSQGLYLNDANFLFVCLCKTNGVKSAARGSPVINGNYPIRGKYHVAVAFMVACPTYFHRFYHNGAPR